MTATIAASAAAGAPPAGRPWLKAYPPGVPAVIDEAGLTSLAEMFRDSVRLYAERAAVESFGKRMTYGELGQAADAVASWLQAQKAAAAH